MALTSHNGFLEGNGGSAYAAHADHNHDDQYAAIGSGGGSGVMFVGTTTEQPDGEGSPIVTLDKTFNEIYDALDSGTMVFVKMVDGTTINVGQVNVAGPHPDGFAVVFSMGTEGVATFIAESEDDYPEMSIGTTGLSEGGGGNSLNAN